VLVAGVLAAGCSSASSDGAADRTASPVPSGSAPASAQPSRAAGTYVALGDSVPAGVGAPDPAVDGYVPLLARLLAARCDGSCDLAVRNLAVPGATTASLRSGQLPQALELLTGGGDVRLVTLTVGGNDVFAPVLQSCAAAPEARECRSAVVAAVRSVDATLDDVLAQLQAAAAPGAVVAVMTYDDPLPACRLAPLSALSQQVLEGAGSEAGLNDVLRARALEHGAVVVETAGRLRVPDDFVGGLDCLHPSGSGHARIAEAFAAAVGDRLR
jgi:lysophospholipase L1-like esterase